MKKNTNSIFIILIFSLFSNLGLNAQSMLKEISLKQQIEKSSLVVEGKVISKQSFWDVDHHHIFTVNTIEVYKIFKGEKVSIIEIITPGGYVGLKAETVTHSLKLREGDLGVFTLKENKTILSPQSKSINQKFKAYSAPQGFYKYNLHTDVAVNPFHVKRGISSSFYNEIMSYTKSSYIKMSSFKAETTRLNFSQNKSAKVLAITGFTPTISTAGTASVLTITGTDFGTVKGKVGFSDADDGGATFIDALDMQVLTWGDTEITVEIPSGAGTGKIRVTHDDTSSVVSTGDLTISYAQSTVEGDFGDGELAYPVQHVAVNGSGGYTWTKTVDFDGITDAETSFTRALDTWRCETKVNWVVDGTAIGPAGAEQNKTVEDGINIIAFDDSTSADPDDDLPDGVLGRCTSYYTGCGPSPFTWYVDELDIVFDDEVSWEMGPGLASGSDIDFESVALHELGHAHQLGHVIEPIGAVMHYALAPAENIRTLTVDDIAGADDVQDRSNGPAMACGMPLMIDYSGSCGLSVEDNRFQNAISIYPNPAKRQFYIKNESFVNLVKAVIYDISGRLISEYDISNTSRTKSINVLGVSKGIYFVNIHSETAILTKKIVFE